MMFDRLRFSIILTILAVSGCHYQRDCSSPLRRTIWVDPQLLPTAKRAALEWYDKTDGWEIIDVKSPIPRQKPIPGDTHVTFKEIPTLSSDAAGIYYQHNNTIFIEPAYKNDVDVMMHELGHALGLPHLGPPGTTMHPNIIGTKIDPQTCKHICCKPKNNHNR